MSYETEQDLSREMNDSAEFCLWLNCGKKQYELEKIPQDGNNPVADFWIKEQNTDNYIAVLEHKHRNYTHAQLTEMGGAFITKKKYDHMMRWVASGYRATLLMRFKDQLFFMGLSNPHSVTFREGGRKDRGDPNDITQHAIFTNPNDWLLVPKQFQEK